MAGPGVRGSGVIRALLSGAGGAEFRSTLDRLSGLEMGRFARCACSREDVSQQTWVRMLRSESEAASAQAQQSPEAPWLRMVVRNTVFAVVKAQRRWCRGVSAWQRHEQRRSEPADPGASLEDDHCARLPAAEAQALDQALHSPRPLDDIAWVQGVTTEELRRRLRWAVTRLVLPKGWIARWLGRAPGSLAPLGHCARVVYARRLYALGWTWKHLAEECACSPEKLRSEMRREPRFFKERLPLRMFRPR